MGFFDEYPETGGDYIGKDEKQELIDNEVPFAILSAKMDDHPQYGERYVVRVVLDSDAEQKERVITFQTGSVESRDRMLENLSSYLEVNPDDKPRAVLAKVGRSILLKRAE